MKQLLTLIVLLTVATFTVNAQYEFIKQWDKRYGGYGGNGDEALDGLVCGEDGSLFISGSSPCPISGDKTEDSRGSYDYWIVKVDSNGNKIWDRRFGGNRAEGNFDIASSKDGGVVVVGYSDSNAGGDVSQNNRGGGDMWAVKVNADGNKVWDKLLGGNRSDIAYAVVATNDGGYLIGGESNSDAGFDKTEPVRGSSFYSDGWVVKIDSLGNKEWDKTLGGLSQDRVYGVGQTQDGGYLALIYTISDPGGDLIDSTHGETDGWVVKLNPQGQIEWQWRYGGSGDDGISSMGKISGNRVLLLGGSNSPADGNRTVSKRGYWLIVIDSVGNPLEQYAYNGAAGISSLQVTADKGYLISGSSRRSDLVIGAIEDRTEDCLGRGNVWVLKLDSSFNKQWDKVIFTTGEEWDGYSVETHEGCYVVATQSRAGIGGYKTQAAWDNSYDYFVVKFCMERVSNIDSPLNPPEGDLIQVWPNPVSEEVSIALLNGELGEATFTLTDVNGKTIYRKAEDHLAPGYTKVLDLRPLPKGVYFITVETAQGQWVKRVVKE